MRQKKDGKYLNVNIITPIYTELEYFSIRTGISKTSAVEQALRMYMDDYYGRNKSVKNKIVADLNGEK